MNGNQGGQGGIKIVFDKPIPAYSLDNSGSVSSRAVRHPKPQDVLESKCIIEEP
jgi:hypothetical protein